MMCTHIIRVFYAVHPYYTCFLLCAPIFSTGFRDLGRTERLDAPAGKPGGALRRVGKTLSEPWLMTQLTLLLCLNLLHGLQQSTTGLLRYAVAGVLAHAVFSSTDAVSVFAENQHLRTQISLTGGALSHLVTLVLSVEFFSVARLL